MKRFGLLVALALCGVCFFGQAASAHQLESDRNIGAILHINPDDDPTAGTPSNFILAFTDTTHAFNLLGCKCNLIVKEGTQIIESRPLEASFSLESKDSFTFPQPDVYTLEIQGKPKPSYTFQSFTLRYIVRVEASNGQTATTQTIPLAFWLGFAGFLGLCLLALYKQFYINKQDSQQGKGHVKKSIH